MCGHGDPWRYGWSFFETALAEARRFSTPQDKETG
jgi:hypothetical protein